MGNHPNFGMMQIVNVKYIYITFYYKNNIVILRYKN